VIRYALCKTAKVGLAQLTITGREWLLAVAPLEDGHADELRNLGEYFEEMPATKPQKEMIDLAVQLIEKKVGPIRFRQI